MRGLTFIALLAVGGAAFFFFGGAEKLGLQEPSELPETIAPPNATFVGNEQTNPFAK